MIIAFQRFGRVFWKLLLCALGPLGGLFGGLLEASWGLLGGLLGASWQFFGGSGGRFEVDVSDIA